MSNVLYRTESAYGSQNRDIREVLLFEIVELGNTDVLDYVVKHYAESFPDELLGHLKAISDESGISKYSDQELCNIVNQTVDCLSCHFNVKLMYCLWLADKEAVIDLYGGTEETMDAYSTSDFILSDLGRDGILFAYESLPQPINMSGGESETNIFSRVQGESSNRY